MIELSGPLGKFVLKKTLKELGLKPDDFPEEKLENLVKLIIPKVVFDKSLHHTAYRTLVKKLATSS